MSLRLPPSALRLTWLWLLCLSALLAGCASHRPPLTQRFDFARDTFAFTNQTAWSYHVDPQTGRQAHVKRDPPPTYSLRCFVMARGAKQFHLHAHFRPDLPRLSTDLTHQRVQEVLGRSARHVRSGEPRIELPGFSGLREFSALEGSWLQANLGGAWQSYVQRGHWRMVLPLGPRRSAREADRWQKALAVGYTPVVHLVTFPQLTLNHAVVVYAAQESEAAIEFTAYDPNDPNQPLQIYYHRRERSFSLPATAYFAGGAVKAYEVFRNWAY